MTKYAVEPLEDFTRARISEIKRRVKAVNGKVVIVVHPFYEKASFQFLFCHNYHF